MSQEVRQQMLIGTNGIKLAATTCPIRFAGQVNNPIAAVM
jgi:hypothetical protein